MNYLEGMKCISLKEALKNFHSHCGKYGRCVSGDPGCEGMKNSVNTEEVKK